MSGIDIFDSLDIPGEKTEAQEPEVLFPEGEELEAGVEDQVPDPGLIFDAGPVPPESKPVVPITPTTTPPQQRPVQQPHTKPVGKPTNQPQSKPVGKPTQQRQTSNLPAARPAASVPAEAKTPATGFLTSSFGETMNRFPIPRLKFSENAPAALVLFTTEMFFVRYHYFDGLGYVFCVDGVCCREDQIPPIRIAIPVIHLTAKGATVKYIMASEDQYDSLKNKWEDRAETGGLINRLIKITCSDQQYQKWEADILDKYPFNGREEILQTLVDFYNANKMKIAPSLARSLTEDEIADALGVDKDQNFDESSFFQ